jgi:hypothetical protein
MGVPSRLVGRLSGGRAGRARYLRSAASAASRSAASFRCPCSRIVVTQMSSSSSTRSSSGTSRPVGVRNAPGLPSTAAADLCWRRGRVNARPAATSDETHPQQDLVGRAAYASCFLARDSLGKRSEKHQGATLRASGRRARRRHLKLRPATAELKPHPYKGGRVPTHGFTTPYSHTLSNYRHRALTGSVRRYASQLSFVPICWGISTSQQARVSAHRDRQRRDRARKAGRADRRTSPPWRHAH